MSDKSDTPRVDAFFLSSDGYPDIPDEYSALSFARQLERALSAAQRELAEANQRAERAEAALVECRRDAERYQKLCTEFQAENSKLRSALELVHFKREPWQ
jgi:hypothetical protein